MALHIAIDARRVRDFGIGTYIRGLVKALGGIDSENRYTLVTGPADARALGAGCGHFGSCYLHRHGFRPAGQFAFPFFYAASWSPIFRTYLLGPACAPDGSPLRSDHPRLWRA